MLNNGITILAGKASKVGYKKLEIDDPQIVNGLQTSRQIDAYFRGRLNFPDPEADNRRVMVRVLHATEVNTRDSVIRATNSQNKMPAEALRATDRIHSQIEALFRQYDLYYDRRKGQYKDEGKPIAKIVSVVELLQAMLAIPVQRPDAARGRPRDYIKDDDKYAQVFGSEMFDLTVYVRSVLLQRRIDRFLAETPHLDIGHIRNLKFYLSMYVAAAAVRQPVVVADSLRTLDITKIDDSVIDDCYNRLWKQYSKLADKLTVGGEERDYDGLAKGQHLLKAVKTELRRRFTPRKRSLLTSKIVGA